MLPSAPTCHWLKKQAKNSKMGLGKGLLSTCVVYVCVAACECVSWIDNVDFHLLYVPPTCVAITVDNIYFFYFF